MNAPDLQRGLAAANPVATLLALINAGWTTQVVRTACELDLADHLARGGARTAEALATAADCDAAALARLLRAMQSLGLCERAALGAYRLTPLGERLRSDHPQSLHHWARHAGGVLWQRLGELPQSVRTGRSWPQRHHGCDGYAHLSADVQVGVVFHRAMVELTRVATADIAAAIEADAAVCFVDVGGGSGELLAALLARHASARGVLFDQPAALAHAAVVMEAAGVSARCRSQPGDFFQAVPGGGDLYLLKSVLHNWDDAHCAALLRCCAQAMPPGARLLVIERVLPQVPGSGPGHQSTARSDLNMLVSLGGRERTQREYSTLLSRAGLRLAGVRAAGVEWQVLEARHA